MAIAFVQGRAIDGATSLSYSTNVAAASFLWAVIRRGGTASQPSAVSGGVTWVKIREVTVGTDHTLGLWAGPNASGGAVNVSQTGGAGSSRMIIGEASGIATASPLDVDATPTTGTSSTPTGPSITPATADTLVLGGFSTLNDELVGFTPGAGYTEVAADINKVAAVYKIISSASAQTPNTSLDSGSNDWGAISAAFKIAGGGGGGGRTTFGRSGLDGHSIEGIKQFNPTLSYHRHPTLSLEAYRRDQARAHREFMAKVRRAA